MKIGSEYKTKNGKTVKALCFSDPEASMNFRDPRILVGCLLEGYILCWYDIDGICQMFDASEGDNINIKNN